MSGLQCLATENIWFDKHRYDEAEKRFYEGANGPATHQQQVEIAVILFFLWRWELPLEGLVSLCTPW